MLGYQSLQYDITNLARGCLHIAALFQNLCRDEDTDIDGVLVNKRVQRKIKFIRTEYAFQYEKYSVSNT